MQAKVQKLVVDTSAFINVVSLWEYADEFYCIEDVIKEIKNRRTLQHIDSFPFQLHFREPSPASVKFINDFTKKTGDFASLSLTDVKLLALTYELEVENRGDASHLCLEPIQQRTALIVSTKSSTNSSDHVEGFYNPPKQSTGVTGPNDTPDVPASKLARISEDNSPIPVIDFRLNNNHLKMLNEYLSQYCFIGKYLLTAYDSFIFCELQNQFSLLQQLVEEVKLKDQLPQMLKICQRYLANLFGNSNAEMTFEDINSLEQIAKTFCEVYCHLPHFIRWFLHMMTYDHCELEDMKNTSNLTFRLEEIFDNLCPHHDNNGFSKSEELSTEDISGAFEELKVISEEIEDENSYNNEVNGIETKESADEVKKENFLKNIEPQTKEIIDAIETEDLKDSAESEDHENCSSEEEYVYSMDEDCNFEEEDDDEGWITPSNIKSSRQEPLPDDVQIACITGDYAMQNILKHIGLHVLGVDGKVIKSLRTYILRCFACFKTTSKMWKIFCPSCGNKTLKKVAVTLNPDGTQKIWISNRKPINVRGTLCPLPLPKGGHHAKNPILVADQRITPHKIPRKSRMRNNPMHEDYIVQAGVSPFITRDVYSRSAQLGFQTGRSRHRGMLNHEQRGQNSSHSRGTSRRKKR